MRSQIILGFYKPAQAWSLSIRLLAERPRLQHTGAPGSAQQLCAVSVTRVSPQQFHESLPGTGTWGFLSPLLSVPTAHQAIKSTLHFVAELGWGEGQCANRISVPHFLAGSGEGPWVALLERLAEFKKQIMHCPWSLGIPGS